VNKKLVAFLSILSLSLSLPVLPVNAAVKAGGACSSAGITSVSSNKTYTCIKSGKKLVWNKGVVVKSVSVSSINPIRLAAFNSAQAFKCGSTQSKFNLKKEIGPKFPKVLQDKVDSLLEHDMKCFNDFFDRTVELRVFYVYQTDDDFVKTVVNTAINPSDVGHMNSVMEDMKAKKWGSSGMVGGFVNWSQDRSYITMVINATENFVWEEKYDKLVTHEFTHVMQQMYRTKLRSDEAGYWYRQIPGYFMEGGAEALGYIFQAKSVDALNSQMQYAENDMSRDPASIRFKNVSSESEMLTRMKETISPTDDGSYNIQYPIGGLISEYIVGNYGFEKYLKLIQNTGTYSSFNDNLQNTLGLSQDQLLTDSAPYVYTQWKVALKY